ncbi:unnamed protein product [Amoebophrya sp. A120]|nr:unnamed protein product [Amoebophrya sp. A120]|eukprot:GSA120T00010675001.1
MFLHESCMDWIFFILFQKVFSCAQPCFCMIYVEGQGVLYRVERRHICFTILQDAMRGMPSAGDMSGDDDHGIGIGQRKKPRVFPPQKQWDGVMTELKSVQIKRLARRGGVSRLSRKVAPEVRDLVQKWMEKFVEIMVLFCDNSNKTTIRVRDVTQTMKRVEKKTILGYSK